MWFDKGKYITSSRYEKRIRQCNRYRCRSHHQKRPQYHFHYRRCHHHHHHHHHHEFFI